MFLVFIGASGAGKSSLVNCIPKSLYNKMSIMASHAFLSSFEGGRGMLAGKTKAGILIPDFNALCVNYKEFEQLNRIIIAIDDDTQELERRTGNRDSSFAGKISMIGASTDTILEYESLYQKMGRRFLYYALPNRDIEFGKLSPRRAEPEKDKLTEITLAFKTYIESNKILSSLPELQDEQRLYIQNMAHFSVLIRNTASLDKLGTSKKKEDSINRFVRDYSILAQVLTHMGYPFNNILKTLAVTAVPHHNFTVYDSFNNNTIQIKAEWIRSLNYLGKSQYVAAKVISNALELGIVKTLIDKDSKIFSYYLEPRFKTIIAWWYSI
jgi:GTPase SAR1 family protein